MRFWLPALSLAFLAACSSSEKHYPSPHIADVKVHELPTSLKEAVRSPYRRQENLKRDEYRHPLETLTFFGVEPNMTVVEVAPGAGWYTEILAPYLSAHGVYVAAGPFGGEVSEYFKKNNAKLNDWSAEHPDVGFQRANFNPPDSLELAPEGSADMVLTFRNVHNWSSKGNEEKVFAAFFRALKPGGVLGVVEHRANADAPEDLKSKSGYLREIDVVKMAERAGFTLVGRSDINANPKDTKDHPEGVWTLPPSLRLGDKDRAKYEAIGESDRMTLKFKKLEKLPREAKGKKHRRKRR